MTEPQQQPLDPTPADDANPAEPHAAHVEKVYHNLLAWMGQVPHEVLTGIREKVKKSYARLEDRYGPRYARVIIGAGLAGLVLPVPFSSALTAAPVMAVAEIHRDLSRDNVLARVRSAVEMSAAEIGALGKRFLRDLLDEFGVRNEPGPDG